MSEKKRRQWIEKRMKKIAEKYADWDISKEHTIQCDFSDRYHPAIIKGNSLYECIENLGIFHMKAEERGIPIERKEFTIEGRSERFRFDMIQWEYWFKHGDCLAFADACMIA